MGEGSRDAARALKQAEDRLRARGMTGARAFEALLDALTARVDGRLDFTGLLSELPLRADVDLLGLAYERFFADLFKGARGQYFTPPPIVALLLGRAGLVPGERVLDPTCGSGGMLVEAARRGAVVAGIDRDPLLARLAALNLRLAGFAGPVRCADFFAEEPAPVDVVVANPPFSVAIDEPDVLARYALGRGRERALSDHLFAEAIEAWVRPGGRAALVLPWSILTNPSAQVVRDRIDAAFVREAACALPEGVFRPFGGAAGRAFLLWLRRRPGAERAMAWANLTDPGYDPRSAHVKPTTSDEIERLVAGEGWTDLPIGAWAPGRAAGDGPRVRDRAALAGDRVVPSRDVTGPVGLADLADADKATGEVAVRTVPAESIDGPRAVLADGDVLVARMRPELGNVAVLHAEGLVVGSPEWVALRGPHAHWLLHALRTPTWRAALPVTEGQTRPRIGADTVLDSPLPWPGEDVASRVHALSSRIFAERALLRGRLDAVQALVDAFAEGSIDDEALSVALSALESAT